MIEQYTATALAVMGLVVWGVYSTSFDVVEHCRTVTTMDANACIVALS